MNRPLRFLMGVGIVAILTPAMAMVLPNNVTGLIPWHTDNSMAPGPSPALAAVDRDIQLAETSDPTTLQTPSSQVAPPTNEVDLLAEASASTSAEQSNDPTTTADNDSTSSNEGDSSSGSQAPTSTTETSNPPKSSTTSTSTPSRNTSGTITGQACPCTVTGTVELKGDINLEGDLIVDGGMLVARPGVNVDGNGFQIMFMNGGKADFQGSKVFTWSDRGAKQNLERDIVFRNMKRIMWMNGGGKSILKYFTVADSGTSSLGDYPLHWHLNGNTTRGTIVEGVVVVNGKNHAFVPHGSHGITFRDIIAKNIRNAAIWWDNPGTNESCNFPKFCTRDNSNDTVFEHALVDGAFKRDGDNGYHRASGFRLNAGSGNVIRNSAAINIRGGVDCSGFFWTGAANGNEGGNVWTFQNNYSKSSSCHGIFVWQNDSNSHLIDGFTGSGIDHGAYSNSYTYQNFNVPYVEIHAAGWEMRNGHIGTVYAGRHQKEKNPTVTFNDVSIDRFVIDNGRGEPGHYVLNNTGLTCEDVEYKKVVEGSSVTVDGEAC